MITSAIKMFFFLVIFLFVMSIKVKDRTLFSHIYDLISPATKHAQNETEKFLEKSFSSTKSYSKKIFDNSVPKVKDAVDSKLSSQKKHSVEEPAEKITNKEKAQLDQLIKNH